MKKILIIEDDPVVRNNIETLLLESNYDVVQTKNGIEGISCAQTENPDLIISDILMPDINGYEVLEVLSRNPDTASIPFIFLTAKTDLTDMRKGMDLGADDYLMKPFKAGQLLNAIEIRLSKYERLKLEKRKNEQPENTEIQTPTDKPLSVLLGSSSDGLKYSEIVFISAEDVYTNVILANGKTILLRKLLKTWEQELAEMNFLRIHRSTMINLNYLAKIEKWYNGTYKIFLKHTENPFIISRGYAKILKQKFEK